MSQTLAVGKDVLSYCGKCKLTLSHIIMSMKDHKKPHKVKCNTCKAEHAFKDPSTANKKKRSPTKKSKKIDTMPLAQRWQMAVDSFKGNATKYSIKSIFHLGDMIDHPTFGRGVVDEIVDNDKIAVMFQADIKTLVHNKN
jgi:hypothetical protein